MKQKPLVNKGTSNKSHLHRFHIKIEDIAFWFWFSTGIEGCLTFLFFQSQPALGTLVGYLPAASFAFFLSLSLFAGKQVQTKIFKPLAANWLIALSLWAGITLLWTGANPRFSACGYWGTLVLKILVVLLLLALGNVEQVSIKSLQGFTWGSLLFALSPFIMQARTIEGRLGNEYFLHPNNIGNQMAITCLCAIYLVLHSSDSRSERLTNISILLFLLFTLLNSLSKTSIMGFLIAALVYLLYNKISIKKKLNLILASSTVIAICFVPLSKYLDQYINEQQGGEALATASGRTQLWKMAWEMIAKNPIWGYGYQSYRDIADQSIGLRLVHPHNEILNIWFNLGGIGLILGLFTYLTYAWQIYLANKANLPQAVLGLALLIYFLIRGFTEATVPDFLVYPSALMMLMIVWMNQKQPYSITKNS